MSVSKNNIFEITSFLSGSNVAYIKEMYEKFSSNPESVPESWREYFSGLGENKDLISQDTKGPGHSNEPIQPFASEKDR